MLNFKIVCVFFLERYFQVLFKTSDRDSKILISEIYHQFQYVLRKLHSLPPGYALPITWDQQVQCLSSVKKEKITMHKITQTISFDRNMRKDGQNVC